MKARPGMLWAAVVPSWSVMRGRTASEKKEKLLLLRVTLTENFVKK